MIGIHGHGGLVLLVLREGAGRTTGADERIRIVGRALQHADHGEEDRQGDGPYEHFPRIHTFNSSLSETAWTASKRPRCHAERRSRMMPKAHLLNWAGARRYKHIM